MTPGRTALLLALLLAPPARAIDVAASPDVRVSLSGTPVRDREVAIDDQQGGILIEDFGGLPDGVDVDAFHEDAGGRISFSVDRAVSLAGGVVAAPGDVVRSDGADFVIDFDASAHGVPDGVDLDAFARLPSGELLLSFDVAVALGGVRADDEDVLRFDGSAFALHFDGSAAGVDPVLDLDGVAYAGGGELAVSFDGGGSLGGVVFQDEDVLTLAPSGANPQLFFDASAAHTGWADADLDALAIPEPGSAGGLAAGTALTVVLARRRRSRMQRR